MAYQATTAAGTGDVLDKIRLFAIAQGWTENRWRDSTETHLGKELCISHADAGYFNLMHNKSLYAAGQPNSDNDIALNASSGFDATKKTYEQADKSADSRCALYDYDDANTRNVYLFGNTQYIYVAQELATNFYTHLCFGKIDKAWSYTGGQFVSATWWNFQRSRRTTRTIADIDTISLFSSEGFTSKSEFTYPIYSISLRCDFADSIGANWHNSHKSKQSFYRSPNPRPNDGYINGGYPSIKYYRWVSPYGELSACLPQTMNALSPLLPIVPTVLRNNTNYLVGQWPDVRYVDLSYIEPKQEITLGSDTWVCFPLIAKHQHNAPTGAYAYTSGVLGIAFKK